MAASTWSRKSLTQLEQEFGGRSCGFIAIVWWRGDRSAVERGAETEGEVGWSVVLEGVEEKLPVSRRQWAQVKSLVARKQALSQMSERIVIARARAGSRCGSPSTSQASSSACIQM